MSDPSIGASPGLGQITEITGSTATVLLQAAFAPVCPPIGSILTVNTRHSVVLCLTTAMSMPQPDADGENLSGRIIGVELVGELAKDEHGNLHSFQRGVSTYPKLADSVHAASADILRRAYQYDHDATVEVGVIHQDTSIPAAVKVDDLLGKHFAIVGSTGTGKSCTTALILRQVLSKHPNAHVVLLDPHSEYHACFGDAAEVAQLSSLRLPYWFLTFEEIVEVLIGSRPDNSAEIEILRDLIPTAKYQYGSTQRGSSSGLHKLSGAFAKFSVDVPVPYRMSDLIALIDNEMGKLEKKHELGPYKRLRARIETLSFDSRYSFMFGSLTVEDNLKDVLKQIFRVPVNGKPISIVQLTGVPSEIVNVVVSVLARLAFDLALWSDGKVPITLVCEEAHRYIPRETKGVCFEPTKQALARIAKEGRKYGISLCIVSQRPGDLDPTILSQCSTLITMRLSSESDQKIVESALSDAASSLLQSLPALGTREAIIFGEGVALPSRIRLSELPADALPAGNSRIFSEGWSHDISDDAFLDQVIGRWRAVEPNSETAPSAAQTTAAQTVAAGLPEGVDRRAAPGAQVADKSYLHRRVDDLAAATQSAPPAQAPAPVPPPVQTVPQAAAPAVEPVGSPALRKLAERVKNIAG